MDKLNNITQEDYFMSESEALEWADWMDASIYDEGLEHGIEKTQKEMIQSMLENHADLEFISKVTGKSIEEIQAMIKKN